MTRQLDLTVQGVVGTNPVLSRVGDKARPYCRFRVAVTPTYRTDQGWNNAETIWFTAKAWGRLAANLSHSVRKGDAVLLTGRFSQESWESDGRKHETNVITLQAAGHDLTRGESRFARQPVPVPPGPRRIPSTTLHQITGRPRPQPTALWHPSLRRLEPLQAHPTPAGRRQRAPSPSSSARSPLGPRSSGPRMSSPTTS